MKYLIYIVKRDIPKFEIAGSAVDIPREDTSLQHFVLLSFMFSYKEAVKLVCFVRRFNRFD